MVAMVRVNIRGTKGIVSSYEVNAEISAATVIQVPKHDKLNIELIDAATGQGPQVLMTKRVGNNLVLSFDGEDNESARSPVWDFTLDTSTTAPVIITNTTDEIGGTAEPGATITITNPSDGSTSTAVADDGGNWSVQPNPIGVGDTDVVVVATDPAGNTNSTVVNGPQDNTAPGEDAFESGSITLTDDVGPVKGTIDDGSTTDDAQPTYSGVIGSEGLADGVVSVNVYDNGTLIGSAAVDQSTGAWSFTPGSALASGSHSFTVAAVDAAGNEGPQVSGTADAGWDFNLLTSAPAQPSIENVSDDYTHGEDADTGFLQKGQATNDGTLTINGSAGPDMTVRIWATDSQGNRVLAGEGMADENGRWSITTTELGADGTYNLTATAVNAAGVSSAQTGAFPIVLDTTAPAAATAELMDDQGEVQGAVAAGGVTDDRTLQLNGTGEPGATVTVILDGATAGSVVVDKDGNWTLPLGTLNDGEHRYQTVIADAAGNETRGDEVSFNVDSSGVEITIDQANDDAGSITGAVLNGGLTDDSTPELQGTTLAGATVTIRDADGKVLGTATADGAGAWTFPLSSVADGEHTWTAEVTNEAGNTAQATLTLTVDATAPEAATAELMDDQGDKQGAVAAGGVTDDRTPQLNGTGEPGATVTVILDGATAGSVVVNKDGNWTLPLGTLNDGEHRYQTVIADAAGNETRGDEVSFTVDSSSAAITIDQANDNAGSRDDGSFVVVFISATDSAPGAGTYGIYAQYFDANGNKVGQQMQINQLTQGDQIEVDATFLEGGQLYVTWTDQGVADGAGSAIKGRIVDLAEVLKLEQETPQNDDPITIDYQPSTEAVADSLPPNVGISLNNSDKLGGQTEPGAIVTVIDAKGNSHVAVADAKGAWHLEPNPLGVGENGYISAADTAGNSSAPILIRGTALDGYDLLNESTQVNTSTTNDQANPTVTQLADGRIVVIWQSNDGSTLLPDNNVYMQLYEADGVHKIGTEQQVNQRTASYQDSPQVVALADGGFLVVYESYNGGLDNSGDGVIARRYGSDGQAVTDEFLVNTATSGNQNSPSAMATPDGGYIITWQDQNASIVQRTYGPDNQPETDGSLVASGNNMGTSGGPEMAAFTDAAHGGMYITVWNATNGPSDGSSTGVVGQIFGADGKPLGNAFQVNTTMDGGQNYPDVITLKDGSFVVYWDSTDSGAKGNDIRAVHYTVDPVTGAVSVKGTGDFIVNSYTDGKQYKPVGVALEDGGYLIIWGSQGGDGSGSAIYAQRYDANDHKVGREFIVNTTTDGNQGYGGDVVDVTHILDATLMADGNVYVSWQSDNVDGSRMGIEGIVVDPNAAYYSEFTVNSTTAGNQSDPMVVSLPNGGLFQVWVSANGDGSGTGIRGQMLDAKGQPVGSEFTVNNTVAGNQLTPVVLENGNIGVVWTSPASGNSNYIKCQQYTYTYDSENNVNGLTAVGPEFNISSGAGAVGQAHPDITALSDGGYLVVWEAIVSDEYRIFGRQYGADGSPVTEEMILSSTGLGVGIFGNSNFWSPLPSITQTSDGKVAIVFATGGDGYDSSVLMYDPVTHTAGSSVVVNQTTSVDQASANVSALDNGNFIVTWDSNNISGPDQSGYGVWGRIYDANGQVVSDEFLVNTVTAGDQHLAKVVSRADGSFVAVFISATDTAPGTGTDGIYAQYFDAHGNKIGQQMQINQLTYGNQVEVDATFMEGGQLYVTWTDRGVGDGSGSAIKGRIVDLNKTLDLSDDGNGVTHIEYQPAQFYVNGTEGNDSLDARSAITVDAKGGSDTIYINGTNFTSIDGGDGYDTLVWDSVNNFELGSVSSNISGIEVINIGNSAAQTLVISASDILDMTKANGDTEHTLKITGDDGNSNNNGAKDTVNIDKSVWTTSGSQTENGVNYDVYIHNDDTTVKLIIQNGLNVV